MGIIQHRARCTVDIKINGRTPPKGCLHTKLEELRKMAYKQTKTNKIIQDQCSLSLVRMLTWLTSISLLHPILNLENPHIHIESRSHKTKAMKTTSEEICLSFCWFTVEEFGSVPVFCFFKKGIKIVSQPWTQNYKCQKIPTELNSRDINKFQILG